jgi:hypothetical protein
LQCKKEQLWTGLGHCNTSKIHEKPDFVQIWSEFAKGFSCNYFIINSLTRNLSEDGGGNVKELSKIQMARRKRAMSKRLI